jgi:hypothetical protein
MKLRVFCRHLKLGILVLAALLVLPIAVSANDLVYFTQVPNTDFAAFGTDGMRGLGTGSIVVAGVTGTVTAAYIFWHGPGGGNDLNASVTFNGTPVTGVNIGISNNNCWGFTDSRAYRANVTALVPGDGTYALSNFTKTGDEVNGVSLVILFNDGNPLNNRDVVIFNGNDSNQPNSFDAVGWNATLSGINYTSGTVNTLFIVSDGQTFPDDELRINNTVILPAGQNWDGATLPGGGDLWDHRVFDLTSLFVVGPNTLTIQPAQVTGSDCLSLIAVVFDLPLGAAGATPTPVPAATPTPGGGPTAPVPTLSASMLALLGVALLLVAILVIRRSA